MTPQSTNATGFPLGKSKTTEQAKAGMKAEVVQIRLCQNAKQQTHFFPSDAFLDISEAPSRGSPSCNVVALRKATRLLENVLQGEVSGSGTKQSADFTALTGRPLLHPLPLPVALCLASSRCLSPDDPPAIEQLVDDFDGVALRQRQLVLLHGCVAFLDHVPLTCVCEMGMFDGWVGHHLQQRGLASPSTEPQRHQSTNPKFLARPRGLQVSKPGPRVPQR